MRDAGQTVQVLPGDNMALAFGIFLLLLSLDSHGQSAPSAKAQNAIPVIASEVKLAEFADRAEALGTLKANESVSLTASVTETVFALHFDDGERVEKLWQCVKNGTIPIARPFSAPSIVPWSPRLQRKFPSHLAGRTNRNS